MSVAETRDFAAPADHNPCECHRCTSAGIWITGNAFCVRTVSEEIKVGTRIVVTAVEEKDKGIEGEEH